MACGVWRARRLSRRFLSSFVVLRVAFCSKGTLLDILLVLSSTWYVALVSAVRSSQLLTSLIRSLLSLPYLQTLVAHNPHGWRTLFWVAAGISFFAGTFRAILPESPIFLRARAARREAIARGEVAKESKGKTFLKESYAMLKRHWLLCVYAILLMTGFNFLSHGSQGGYLSGL